MNYKIKITAENHEIVKRIADENGMNKAEFGFTYLGRNYIIKNGIFPEFCVDYNYPELTTEQFIEMFDKQDDFKSKVIELMELERNSYIRKLNLAANDSEFHTAGNLKLLAKELDLLISKIKKL